MKMWENRDGKLVTTEARRNYFSAEPIYHKITFFFFRNFLSHRNEKNTDTHE